MAILSRPRGLPSLNHSSKRHLCTSRSRQPAVAIVAASGWRNNRNSVNGTGGDHKNTPTDPPDAPLIQPSLVIPPPPTGSQYGRNRILDTAAGMDGGGGGGWDGRGGGGNGGKGGGGGGRPGGGADNVFSFGGFFGDRRFGLLPRVLVMVQFLAWSTVLYMLVDTVVNASSRAARKVWNRKINRFEEAPPSTTAAAPEQEAEPGAAEAVAAGLQPEPGEAEGAVGAALAAGAAAAGGNAPHTSEVVMLEDEVVVVEELVTEEPTHGSHGSQYGSPADLKWRQALESALLGSAGHGTAGTAGAGADAGAGSAAAPSHTQVQEVADAALSAAAALPSMGWSPGHDGAAGSTAGDQTGAAAGAGAGAEVAVAAGPGAADPPHSATAPRATFVKYSGARPIEYPVVALFVMIMGSVGFFSTLG